VKAESDEGNDEREQTESSDKQTPIYSRAFQRQILRHDGVELTGLDIGGAERRNPVHHGCPSPYALPA
jgi:hypothetical protein